MANFPVAVGDTVTLPFSVFDIDGITPLTGLVDGDFTKLLVHENTVSANTVTVAEVSGAAGTYTVSFTADQNGAWYVQLATPDEQVFGGYVQAGVNASLAYPAVVGRATMCS